MILLHLAFLLTLFLVQLLIFLILLIVLSNRLCQHYRLIHRRHLGLGGTCLNFLRLILLLLMAARCERPALGTGEEIAESVAVVLDKHSPLTLGLIVSLSFGSRITRRILIVRICRNHRGFY